MQLTINIVQPGSSVNALYLTSGQFNILESYHFEQKQGHIDIRPVNQDKRCIFSD